MIESEIVSGQACAWSLVKKIAEGFTGEVFLAESLVDKRAGIVKRPHRSAFASDAVRQAAQLKTEARILKSLSAAFDLDPVGVAVPALLDQSKPGTDFTERYFIVIAPASGTDLSSMRRDRRIPDHLLLVVISRLFEIFDRIHVHPIDDGSGQAYGVLWNDFKLDHLWWDADRQLLTLIDWSNGAFLQADGKT
jgi:serine/threonine protein kinase